jgi:hypothetical protein
MYATSAFFLALPRSSCRSYAPEFSRDVECLRGSAFIEPSELRCDRPGCCVGHDAGHSHG